MMSGHEGFTLCMMMIDILTSRRCMMIFLLYSIVHTNALHFHAHAATTTTTTRILEVERERERE